MKFVELFLNTRHLKEAPFYAEQARNRKHAGEQPSEARRLERLRAVFPLTLPLGPEQLSFLQYESGNAR